MLTKEFIQQTISKSSKIEQIVQKCHSLLYKYPNAKDSLNYLNSRTSSASQKKFQLGYFPSQSELDLFSPNEKRYLIEIGVLYRQDSYYFSNFKFHTILIPIIDDFGYYSGLIARTTLPEEEIKKENTSKYKYSKFTKNFVLFGLNFAKKSISLSECVYLVEGQFDCISCHANGIHNTVALGGTSFFYYQAFLLKKYGAKKIFLLLDNGEAAEIAEKKIIKNCQDIFSFEIEKIPIISLYKDIDEYLRKHSNLDIFDRRNEKLF